MFGIFLMKTNELDMVIFHGRDVADQIVHDPALYGAGEAYFRELTNAEVEEYCGERLSE